MRRVVITGLGTVNPLGNDVQEFWENIKASKCAIEKITKFDLEGFKTTLAAEVKNFDVTKYVNKKDAKKMSEFSQYAVYAAIEAFNDAGLEEGNYDPERMGTFVATGVGGLSDAEKEVEKLVTKGPGRVSPLFIPMMIGNIASGNVAIALNAKGPCIDTVSACASGNNAIGEAFWLIRNNRADIVAAGGSESAVGRLSIAGFSNLLAVTQATDKNRASIPFDKERSGFVMGEGAGILILEEAEHAINRGAKIYGEVVGYSTTCDAYHITSPSPEGTQGARALKEALEVGNISLDEVDYINAHGTSTGPNDKTETKLVKDIFGERAYKIPMSSSKSQFGHLLGAAGGVEAIVCVKAMEDSFVPPTVNLKVPDPECDLDYVPGIGRNKEINVCVSNSLGFGGHNACLVFKKWEA